MSFNNEKPTIMIKKKDILITPSSKLNPTVGSRGALLQLIFRSFLFWNWKQSRQTASDTREVALAFDDCRRQHFDFGRFRLFGFSERFARRIIQRLNSQTHRLQQDGAAAQNRQL